MTTPVMYETYVGNLACVVPVTPAQKFILEKHTAELMEIDPNVSVRVVETREGYVVAKVLLHLSGINLSGQFVVDPLGGIVL